VVPSSRKGTIILFVTYAISKAMLSHNVNLWVVTPYSLVGRSQRYPIRLSSEFGHPPARPHYELKELEGPEESWTNKEYCDM
jgi:hypothetical protein